MNWSRNSLQYLAHGHGQKAETVKAKLSKHFGRLQRLQRIYNRGLKDCLLQKGPSVSSPVEVSFLSRLQTRA